MEADISKFPAGIFPFTNGWLNHIWLNWHFWSVHHWLIFTIVPIILTTRASAGPAQIGQEANKLNRDFSNTINFLSSWGFTFSISSEDLHSIVKEYTLYCYLLYAKLSLFYDYRNLTIIQVSFFGSFQGFVKTFFTWLEVFKTDPKNGGNSVRKVRGSLAHARTPYWVLFYKEPYFFK